MFCPICGKNMPDGARFCPECGGTTEPPVMASQPSVSGPIYAATPASTPGVGVNTQVMEIPLESAVGTPTATPMGAAAPAPKAKLSARNKGLIAGLGGALAVILIVVAVMSFASPANAVSIDEDEFPDPVFRAYVAENADANKDGKLSQDELDSVTTIDISHVAKNDARVSDLTGIGHFRGLHTLNASHCHIRHLPSDFHHLHELRVCDLTYNQFEQTINVTENYNLIVIYVGGNKPGTDIQAGERTNVITDPNKDVTNDPDQGGYIGGENNERVNPEDVAQLTPPDAGDIDLDDPTEGEGGEGGGTATTGDGTGEGSDEGTGEGSDEGTGEGSDEGTGEGSDEGTGEGSDEGSNEGASGGGAEPAKAASDSDTLFAVQSGSGWGYVDEKGTAVLEGAYAETGAYSEDIALVKDGSTYKYVKANGDVANDVTSEYGALPYSGGFAYVATGKAEPGNGNTASSPLVDATVLEMPGKFYDTSGKELAVSDSLIAGGEFHGGYAPARTSAGWGFINDKGEWTVQPGFDAVTSASNVNGLVVAGVCKQGTWTYINVETGEKAFEGEYSEASAFDSTGHAIAKHKAPGETTSQTAGDVTQEPVAVAARYVPGDAQLVTVADEDDTNIDPEDGVDEDFANNDDLDYGETDGTTDGTAGDTAAEEEAADAAAEQAAAEEEARRQAEEEEARKQAEEEEARRQAEEEEARKQAEEEERQKALELSKKYVVIDATGADVAVLEDVSSARPFYAGYAAVQNADGKWGFVDVTGAKVIECKFKDVAQFHESEKTHEKYAPAAREDGQWGIIDTKGEFVVDAKYTGAKGAGAL